MKKIDYQTLWLMSSRSLLSAALCFIVSISYANPVLDSVASGNIAVQQTENTTVINQTSQKGIVNWNSFNIGANESTHFQQPSGGVTLNRINANQGASQIYGKLTATGQIILVNSAGIFFGPNAYVNVGGLIATTSNITNEDFINGQYRFSSVTNQAGSIINEGQIIAANHGLVALVAPQVINKGLIQANLGHVVLASGNAFTINFAGNELLHFAIDQKATGSSRGVTVTKTGRLIADGGSILITAKAAEGVLDQVINMEGIAQARSVSESNGEIIFAADNDAGVIEVSGVLDASGKGMNETGGQITITGYNLLVDSPAVIDVSGTAGGGNIEIGGKYLGQGSVNANATVIAANTQILADALREGNGGNIIIWSDAVTKSHGTLSAKGGSEGGQGGFIETSSHGVLDVAGITVNLSAPHGKMGTWLLDPYDVYITTSATSGGTFSGGNPNTFTPNANNSNILNTDIENNLATANVTITTAGVGTQNGDIYVNAPISWSSGNTLTFSPDGQIFLNDVITVNGSTLAINNGILTNSGSGSLILNNATLNGLGTTIINSPITLANGSSNTISAASGPQTTINGDINGSANLTLNNVGLLVINGNIGNSTRLTSLTSGAESSINGSVYTTGNQTHNQIILLADGNYIFDSSAGDITFNGPVSGQNEQAFVTINSAGTTTIAETIGLESDRLGSLTINASNIVMNGEIIQTYGDQLYNGLVTLGIDTELSIAGNGSTATFSLTRGIQGNHALRLIGGELDGTFNFNVGGTLALTDLYLLSTNSGSTFNLNVPSKQIFTLTGSDSGNVTGVSGVSGSVTFNGIENISNANGLQNELILQNKANTLQITGAGSGQIDDPINFSGFLTIRSLSGLDIANFNRSALVNNSTKTAVINGVTMSFPNFSALLGGTNIAGPISSVIEQGNLVNTEEVIPDDVAQVTTITQNIDELISDVNEQYLNELDNVKINPYCYAAS